MQWKEEAKSLMETLEQKAEWEEIVSRWHGVEIFDEMTPWYLKGSNCLITAGNYGSYFSSAEPEKVVRVV